MDTRRERAWGVAVLAALCGLIFMGQAAYIHPSRPDACDKIVSASDVAGNAVTATLPGETSKFHYICGFRIVEYAAGNIAGSPTPIVVTTTNLPGPLALTFGTGLSQGQFDTRFFNWQAPIKSSIAGTATTFVGPATPNIIWRINVFYYTSF